MDVSVAAVVVLLGLVLLRWGLILFGALLILQPARSCPACFRATLPIRRPVLNAVLPVAEWRWCPACRWSGPSLKSPSPATPSHSEKVEHWTANPDR
ncbi:MAG TPA: hypothetical protein VGA70_01085 [Longimicrobiales bacterium]|jgi:hypothetical protein